MRTILFFLLIGLLGACQQPPIEPGFQLQTNYVSQGLPALDHLQGHQLSLVGSQVLLTGGSSMDHQPYLFTPATQLWQAIDSTRYGYSYHGAVTLQDGRLLVAGGYQEYLPGREPSTRGRDRAEIWDPIAQSWYETAPLTVGRASLSLSLLQDGRVLAAGGNLLVALNGDERRLRSQLSAMAEIFDPISETWKRVSLMNRRRGKHQAVSLPDGRVLILGGNPPTLDGEIYDPATDEWTLIRALQTDVRHNYRAVVLNDDQILVSGGGLITGTVQTYLYTLSSDTWTDAASMNHFRSEHSLVRLADGKVLAIGGFGELDDHPFYPTARPVRTMEYFDPVERSWQTTTELATPRVACEVLTLPDQRLLVVGGQWGKVPLAEQITFR